MWSGAAVAQMTPVKEDLGLILLPAQKAFSETLISLLSDNRLKNKFITL
jgi:hypothetical protein